MKNPLIPKTWEKLDQYLWQGSTDPKSKEIKPYIAFRGLPAHTDLKTSLQRLEKPYGHSSSRTQIKKALEDRERRIIDTFSEYAREHLLHPFTDWDVLLLGRHHSLPTRLLDWSMSPYVALFFATENQEDDGKDGIVWCVRRHPMNDVLPSCFLEILNQQSGQVFPVKALNENFGSLREFDKCPSALIWFEPPSVSPRIVNQHALFSVMPGVDSRQDKWIEKHPSWYWCVKVPKKLKAEVRSRLHVMNISERIIYPGLDGIAKSIRTGYYKWKISG